MPRLSALPSWLDFSPTYDYSEEDDFYLGDTRPRNVTYRATVDWNSLLYQFGDQIRTIGDAAQNAASALAAAAAELPDDGSANTNPVPEGGNMPTITADVEQEIITVELPIPAESRASAFGQLNLSQSLAENMDEQAWLDALESLRAATAPVVHNIIKGSYDTGRPVRTVGGRETTIDWVDLPTATAIVEAASGGAITIQQQPNPMYYGLGMTNGLEQGAWRLFGSQETFYVGDQLTPAFAVRGLRNAMQNYLDYRRIYRRRYIQSELERRRANPVPVTRVEYTAAQKQERKTKFENFITELKRKRVTDSGAFQHMTVLPHGTLSSRRWGIEIEAVHINGVETPKGWALHGDGSLSGIFINDSTGEPQSHEYGCSHEECDPDDCDGCDCFDNASDGYWTEVGEWNSPVLRSYHSRGLEYLTSEIEHREKNSTPGIHVHVESSDLTAGQAAQLSLMYTMLEPLFESEYNRDTRGYCKEITSRDLADRFEYAQNIGKSESAERMSANDRYTSVNLQSLSEHGTVEFRSMGPVYNYEHLIKWASFCREMVNIAKANVPQSVWSKVKSFKDLLVVFSKYGKETVTPEWATDVPSKDVVERLGRERRMTPNRNDNAPRIWDVFDDYMVKKPVLNAVRRDRYNTW